MKTILATKAAEAASSPESARLFEASALVLKAVTIGFCGIAVIILLRIVLTIRKGN